MSNPSKDYLEYMHSASGGYRATWEPSVPLQIGTLVKIDSYGKPNIVGYLGDLGINIRTSESAPTGGLDLTTKSDVTISVTGKGSVPVDGTSNADADINIQFGSGKGIVFKLGTYKIQAITNRLEIEPKVLALYNDDKWDTDLLIVSELYVADTATIIISVNGSSSLGLKANAAAGIANLDLTNAALGLSVVSSSGSTEHFIACKGATPLYRVIGLKGGFMGFGGKKMDTRDPGAAASTEPEPLSLAPIEPEASFDY